MKEEVILNTIKSIVNEFSEQQLKLMEINSKNGEIITFEDIMIATYGKMHLKTQFSYTKIIAATTIKTSIIKDKLNKQKKLSSKEIGDFVNSFNFLFTDKKPSGNFFSKYNFLIQIWRDWVPLLSVVVAIIALVIKK